MNKLESLLKSRRFWATLATLVAIIAADGLGLDVSADAIQSVAIAVAAWVVGDGLRETK